MTIRKAPHCDRCEAPVEFYLHYVDPDKPGEELNYSGHTMRAATLTAKACAIHMVDVNYDLLVAAGLAPKLPQMPLNTSDLIDAILDKKEDGYVGTTD